MEEILYKKSIISLVILILFTMNNVSAQTDKLVFKPYGYFKLDMAYDQARTNDGNFVFWVDDPGLSKDKDSEFNMTARQTRIGANINYEGLEGREVSARVELDFYGDGAENKNMLMMRHGYLKVDLGKYYLLAGQTSDVLSPLVPTTVNYTVLWNCGNIGYRHPQIQIGNIVKKGLEIVGGLTRNISGDNDSDGNDDGEDSSLPTVQARLSYIDPDINIGISGHYGVMEYTNNKGENDNYNSYSLNFHASYSFTKAFLVKGEFFTGKTLDQYFGGIGQGFDIEKEKEVESRGGWINATLKPNKYISYNVGLGIDQPQKSADLSYPNRNYNRCIFANIYTEIAHNTFHAIEVSNWTTGHYDDDGNEIEISSLRFQTSLILRL